MAVLLKACNTLPLGDPITPLSASFLSLGSDRYGVTVNPARLAKAPNARSRGVLARSLAARRSTRETKISISVEAEGGADS